MGFLDSLFRPRVVRNKPRPDDTRRTNEPADKIRQDMPMSAVGAELSTDHHEGETERVIKRAADAASSRRKT